jgi:hypothetical protein
LRSRWEQNDADSGAGEEIECGFTNPLKMFWYARRSIAASRGSGVRSRTQSARLVEARNTEHQGPDAKRDGLAET